MAGEYTIQLSARAQNDFKSIQRYTLKAYGESQVWKYTALLKEGLMKLAGNPELYGHARSDIPEKYRAYKVGEHSLIHRIDGDVIYVVAILHGTMDFPAQLQ